MKMERIMALATKEAREIWRDKLYLAMGFVVPIMMMMVLGYGLSFDVERIPFAILDQDQSPKSREFAAKLTDSRYFSLVRYIDHSDQANDLLARSQARLILIIPPDFSRQLNAGRPVAVQTLIDGIFPFRADTTRGYVQAITNAFNQTLLQQWLARNEGIHPEVVANRFTPVQLQPRYLYNQAIRSEWSLAPGLMMLILNIMPAFLTALSVVREKESGSIYNLYASSISRGEFIVGKLLPILAISIINILILWLMVTQLFNAPFKGEAITFFAISVVYVICTASVGMLVSILVQTQVAAILVTMVVTLVPGMLYSGLMVPVNSMSGDARIAAAILPAHHYLNIIWDIFLKNLPLTRLLADLAAIIMFAVVLWTIGFWRFSKRPKR
ncbi:ABC transporter permease [Spartinivicinus ruber]|uniref:ABC transporter permease n=1 Tax=Spartinivicinus ruber TaxID=2683272 RepID=UPI0013D2BDB8|nr:ABC transporter permease [Spartinivicinus ruber]